jgi:glucose/arabinose dehydrogenase
MLHPGLAWRTFTGVAAGLLLLSCGDDGGSSSVMTEPTSAGTGMSGSPTTNQPTGSPDDGDDGMTGTPTTTTPSDTTVEPATGTGDESSTGEPPLQCPYEEVGGEPSVALELVASGCDRPMQAIGHPTEPDRLFVVEQGGEVRIVEPGSGQCGDVFLTTDSVNQQSTTIGNEAGLLGFAFHPDFPDDPRVYVDYIADNPLRTVIEEFTVDPGNPNQVDQASGRVVIEFCQPAGNHNGGTIVFDDSGMLLITTGDGGPQNDGLGNGRDPGVLLGKILRIDVESDGRTHTPTSSDGEGCSDLGSFTSYGIPDDNPFVADGNFAPEVWSWGFRNPWRAAWDSETDILYVGDVGQNSREEVAQVVAGSDQGWSDMEGFSCFGGGGCDGGAGPGKVNAMGQTLPLKDWGDGCSAIGGAVYRSCEVPGWNGIYFFGEYACGGQGRVGALVWDPAAETVNDLDWLLFTDERVIGNGWNAYGDVFFTTVDAPGGFINDGRVYRVVPAK